MKTYIKPAVASMDLLMESVMTSFSVVDKGTEAEALTQKKNVWSSEMWTKTDEEEKTDADFR